MKIRCLSNSGVALPEQYASAKQGFGRDSDFDIEIGKEYLVYALTLTDGGLWFYVLDESGRDYPVWYPAPLFSITDSRLSRYWIFGIHGQSLSNGEPIIAFVDWASKPFAYYDSLSDGDREAMATFRKYRELMELEFDTGNDPIAAESLGDGWMQCPNCREVWQTSVSGPLLKCPRCLTVLRNPRLGESRAARES